MTESTETNLDEAIYNDQGQQLQQIDLQALVLLFEQKRRWYKVFFRDILPTNKGARILDMPCGHGNILYFLTREGYQNCHGVDITQKRVDICRELGLPAAACDGIQHVQDSPDESFDIIFSLDFLEHIPRELAFQFIQSCYQKLKIGGTIVCRMPVTNNLLGGYDFYNDLTHKWSANSGCVADLIRLAGFSAVHVRDERPINYKPLSVLKLAAFHVVSNLINLTIRLVGFPPFKIWSRSAYFIATK